MKRSYSYCAYVCVSVSLLLLAELAQLFGHTCLKLPSVDQLVDGDLQLSSLLSLDDIDGRKGVAQHGTTKPKTIVNITRHENDQDGHFFAPTIFHCGLKQNGMTEVAPTMAHILPEYTFQALKGPRPKEWVHQQPTRPYDLFLSPIGLACNGQAERWLQQTFAGQVVYISGESGNPPSVSIFDRYQAMLYLGPAPENYHVRALRVYYLQWVWWHWFHNQGHNELISTSSSLTQLDNKPRNTGKHFLIYAASNCVPFRDQAFTNLAQIAPVHYGGRCRGHNHENITALQTNVKLDNWWRNVEVYHDFRFCLVMEHAKQEGYVTEKILLAFHAGCIPIYYGPTPAIWDLFHKDSFVLYDIDNPQPALERVRYLNENQTAYEEVLLHQPILANGNATIEKYFSFDDSVGGGQLKRRIRTLLGLDQFKFVK